MSQFTQRSDWYRAIAMAFGSFTVVYTLGAIGSLLLGGWQYGTISIRSLSLTVSPVILLLGFSAVSGLITFYSLYLWIRRSSKEMDSTTNIDDDPRLNL